MFRILLGILFLIVGSCAGISALSDRNPISALGGGVIAIAFILCAVALMVYGFKAFGKSNITKETGVTRKCPFCAEMIKLDAVKCRFCGSEVKPITLDAVPEKPIEQTGVKCPRCDFVYMEKYSLKDGWWCPNCQTKRY